LDWCKKIAINVLMVLSPMSFLVLAGINARLHSHVVESKILDRVQSANKIVSSFHVTVSWGGNIEIRTDLSYLRLRQSSRWFLQELWDARL